MRMGVVLRISIATRGVAGAVISRNRPLDVVSQAGMVRDVFIILLLYHQKQQVI